MRHDLHHAQHCRCGQCAGPASRRDLVLLGLCAFLLPVVGLASEPIVAALRSILP